MKKIILIPFLMIFFLGTSFETNVDQCKDVLINPIYRKEKNIKGKINGREFLLYEIRNEEDDYDRFFLLKVNDTFECNHHSQLNPNDFQGYSTNYLKLQKDGFSYSIEYGSRYYYNYEFYFRLINDYFYLKKIEIKSFDKANPKKTKSKSIIVKDNISFNKFNIENYLID